MAATGLNIEKYIGWETLKRIMNYMEIKKWFESVGIILSQFWFY